MVEAMKIMAISWCPQPCSRPPPTHAFAGDSWTLTGMSGSVSCGVTAPFFWVLVHTKFCLCQSCVKFWWLYGGVNGDLLQEGLRHTKVYHSQNPCPRSSPLLTHTSTVDSWTLPGKSGSVSCGVTAPFSQVLVHARFCLCPPRVSFPSPV